MFLSPILILALLFSSCDDNSGKTEGNGPGAEGQATATVSETPIAEATISGSDANVANYDAIESAEISGITYEAEGVTGDITATFTKGTGFVFKGTLTAEDESKFEGLTSLTLGTVKLTGASGSASGEGTATIAVAEGTATVSDIQLTVTDDAGV